MDVTIGAGDELAKMDIAAGIVSRAAHRGTRGAVSGMGKRRYQ
jgi:hypothetical protein